MQRKKLSEMDTHEIQITNNIIYRTQDRLLNIYSGVTERALKALFLINGGGVVALLTYLHDSSPFIMTKLILSLSCFLLGLIMTVFLVAIDFYVCLNFLNKYTANLRTFNSDEMRLEEIQNYATPGLSKITRATVYMGYMAGLLFLAGCAFAVTGFFSLMLH
jgi:hypothetical protein